MSRTPASSALRQVGPYAIEAVLGRGGMGAVYRGRHGETGVVHAVKLLAPRRGAPSATTVARFRREAEALARIAPHPAVAAVHSCGTTDRGELWMAIDLVEGDSLAVHLARSGSFDPLDAARLVVAVARAVEHVHGHGVLHRDIKPENVVLGSDGSPRLVDFGLAYDPDEAALTATGQLVGTPAFMAPEQVSREHGGGSLGPATDVYGLGALLYALVAGRAPFDVGSDINVIAAVMSRNPPPPSREPSARRAAPAVDAVSRRALRKDPAARFGTAAALAEALEDAVVASSVESTGPARRPRWIALVATVATALVVVGAVRVWSARPGTPPRASAEELASAWAGALSRLAAGDLSALEDAEALAEDDDARERERVASTLRKLAAGDPVAPRLLPLDEPPWDELRGAVVAVLAGADQVPALLTLVERFPALAADPATIDALERWAPSFDGAQGELDAALTILARAGVVDGAPRRRLSARGCRLLGRTLETRLAAGADGSELDAPWADALRRHVRQDSRARFDLSPEARRLLLDRMLESELAELEQVRRAELLLATRTLTDAERTDVVVRLVELYLGASVRRDATLLVELTCLLLRDRSFPLSFDTSACDPGSAGDAVARELALPEPSPTRLAAVLLIEAGSDRNAPVAGADAAVLTRRHDAIEALLRVDSTEPEGRLPGWVLAAIGEVALPSGVHDGAIRRLMAARRNRLGQLLDAAGIGGSGEPLRARLFGEALRRERRLPPGLATPQTALAFADCLEIGDPARLDAVVDALTWVLRRPDLYLDAGVNSWRGMSLLRKSSNTIFDVAHEAAKERERHVAEPCSTCDRIRELAALVGATGLLGNAARYIAVNVEWAHGRPEAALAVFDEIGEENDPIRLRALVMGGFIMAWQDRPDDARALLARMTNIDRVGDGHYYYGRSNLWRELGETERAEADLAEYERRHPDAR